ncbi:hypothetical protein SmJEL517_g01746 [Synchytrium microbalum]|uniref:Histone deacetylation protein Rxt3 n=1 Tax=Synchytrium microbalum TaxID=1806994 RepID=A0A507C8S3_9FUNG|nr:uncharacterized protein SmJEL517_g01746 [Synchytrium microbalum]TPX35921.1 hypothetical protein SmJEL517_g01746 [Synchytrium microbalum]
METNNQTFPQRTVQQSIIPTKPSQPVQTLLSPAGFPPFRSGTVPKEPSPLYSTPPPASNQSTSSTTTTTQGSSNNAVSSNSSNSTTTTNAPSTASHPPIPSTHNVMPHTMAAFTIPSNTQSTAIGLAPSLLPPPPSQQHSNNIYSQSPQHHPQQPAQIKTGSNHLSGTGSPLPPHQQQRNTNNTGYTNTSAGNTRDQQHLSPGSASMPATTAPQPTANPFASSQQPSIYAAPPLKKDAAPAPFGARGRIGVPQNNSSSSSNNTSPLPPIPISPYTTAVSANMSSIQNMAQSNSNKGYRVAHAMDQAMYDDESQMMMTNSHSGVMSHHPATSASNSSLIPRQVHEDHIVSEEEAAWNKKRKAIPQEETLGQFLGLPKQQLHQFQLQQDDRKKRKVGDVVVINDDSLCKIPDGVTEKFLGHVVYTGATVRGSNMKQFLLPPFSTRDHYATIEVRVPAKYLSVKDNIAVANMAVWGTNVYTDDSDVVAMAVHAGFFRPYDGVKVDGAGAKSEPNSAAGVKAEVKAEVKQESHVANDAKEDAKSADALNDIVGVGTRSDDKQANNVNNSSSKALKNGTPTPPQQSEPVYNLFEVQPPSPTIPKQRLLPPPPSEPIQGEFNPKTNTPSHDISVTLRILPQLLHYYPSMRHGITSRGWGSSHDGESLRVESVTIIKDRPPVDSSGRKTGSKEWNVFARAVALDMLGVSSNNSPQPMTRPQEGWETEYSLGGGVTVVFSPLTGVACLKYAAKILLDWPPHLRDLYAAIQNPVYGQVVSVDGDSADGFSRAEVRHAGSEGWPYWRLKLNRGDVLCIEDSDNKGYIIKLESATQKIILHEQGGAAATADQDDASSSNKKKDVKGITCEQLRWEPEGLYIMNGGGVSNPPTLIAAERVYWKSRLSAAEASL